MLITSSTPNRNRRTTGTRIQAAPATTPAASVAIKPTGAGHDPVANATAVAAIAPTANCPSAPMLSAPARNEMARPRPIAISGMARTIVAELIAYQEPNAPRQRAPNAAPASYPSSASPRPRMASPARAPPTGTRALRINRLIR